MVVNNRAALGKICGLKTCCVLGITQVKGNDKTELDNLRKVANDKNNDIKKG